MKKLLFSIATTTLGVGLLVSCSRLSDLETRVDNIENSKIADVASQISNINESITTLTAAKSALERRIEALEDGEVIEGVLASLKKADEDIIDRIDILEEMYDSQLSDLTKADEALGKRIDDLKSFVNDQLAKYATTEWANATFATLAEYNKTCETLANLEKTVREMDTKFTTLSTELKSLGADVKDLGVEMESLSEKLESLSQDFESWGEKFSDEMKKAISDSETSIKAWVNTQLAGYYTIAQIDEKLKAMQDELDEASKDASDAGAAIDDLKKQIADQKTALETAKADLVKGYNDAIAKAIKDYDGVIRAAVKDEVDAINTAVSALEGRVTTLEGKVIDLTVRVSSLEGRVQSVIFIPEFTGSGAAAYYTEKEKVRSFSDLELNFEVSPRETAAEDVAKAYSKDPGVLSVEWRSVKNLTKAEIGNTLKIKSVKVKPGTTGVITVTVDAASLNADEVKSVLLSTDKALVLSLRIKTGATDIMSSYIDVIAICGESDTKYVNVSLLTTGTDNQA